MVKCWRYRPKQRPTFKEIIEILLPDLDKNFKKVSYFFSEENAKYEESQKAAAESSSRGDAGLEGGEEEEDTHGPINDYVDEANLPMLGVGASNGHSVELEDIFSDNGSYPHYSGGGGSHKHVGSAEMCDCPGYRDVDEGAAAQSVEFATAMTRHSVCSSPNSAIGGSSDGGSKDSSKSSSSSYAHMNGLSVANGHVPMQVRAGPCYQ